MPYLKISTNVSLDRDSELSLANNASALLGQILGKPESYVMVEVNQDATLVFAGNNQPAAYLELKSIGLPESETKTLSSQLCEHLSSQLDISSDRIYIEFSALARHLWGWNKGTF